MQVVTLGTRTGAPYVQVHLTWAQGECLSAMPADAAKRYAIARHATGRPHSIEVAVPIAADPRCRWRRDRLMLALPRQTRRSAPRQVTLPAWITPQTWALMVRGLARRCDLDGFRRHTDALS